MVKRRGAQADSKQPKQSELVEMRPTGYLGRSDWVVVMLPPVQPEPGWQEYFAPAEPERAAA
jgi:hypothetical protein